MIFIAGPTSSGKTSLGIKLCKEFNGEIVSADSRQIYKYFDVGTGKLPVGDDTPYEKDDFCWEVDGVKIWLYDAVNPRDPYTAVDFKIDANRVIEDIKSRGKVPFIVGGTGFYMASLLGYDIDVGVIKNEALREELQKKTVAELQVMIPQEQRDQINNSDLNNPVRLIRKIEILHSGGELKTRPSEVSPLEESLIVLNRDRSTIYGRVNKWLDLTWEPLLMEIKDLISNGYEFTTPMKGLIYNTALEYIKYETVEKEAREKIKNDLHGYIRRQETWFKKYKQAHFLNPDTKNFDYQVRKTVELRLNERRNLQ